MIKEAFYELEHRRMLELTVTDVIQLLQYHLKGNLNVDKSYQDFVNLSEKFIAKNTESITAEQLPLLMKLMMI